MTRGRRSLKFSSMGGLGACQDEANRRMAFFVVTTATHTHNAKLALLNAAAMNNRAEYACKHGYKSLTGKVRHTSLIRYKVA